MHDRFCGLNRVLLEAAAACEPPIEFSPLLFGHEDPAEGRACGRSGAVRSVRGNARMRAEAEEAAVGALLLASLEVDRAGEEQQLGIEQLAVGQRWRVVGRKAQKSVVEQSALSVVQTRSEHVQPRAHTVSATAKRRHELVRFERADDE